MICNRCGVLLSDAARFCSNCGAATAVTAPTAVSEPARVMAVAASAPAGSIDEQYLGGFTSANLHLRGRGVSSLGYGVYATNRRIIGVNSKKGLVAALAAVGGVTGIAFAIAGSTDEKAKAIAELDQKKDFDVRKEDVWGIEVRRPHGLTVGYLDITRTTGERIRITIADKPEFESIRGLMQAFYAERLTADT